MHELFPLRIKYQNKARSVVDEKTIAYTNYDQHYSDDAPRWTVELPQSFVALTR